MNVRGKRKIGRKILAFVLSVCMLLTVQPNLWDGVMVQAAEKVENDTDVIIQTLRDRIVALPDVEEYLALETDMEKDEDAYAEWEEKLYEYAEEALIIWEEYETLTEEQQAQISEEELAKLTAWVEVSETLSESSQVMAIDDSAHTHCVCGGKLMDGEYNHTEEIIVYDNILASQNGQLLLNSNPVTKDEQSGYQLASGNYYLADDVALDSELVIEENSKVYICLSGHTLSYDRSKGNHRVITVEKGATLNLCTCGNSGVITGGYTAADNDAVGGGIKLSDSVICNMYGCSVEGNQATSSGGGMYISDDVLCNLYNVNIFGNEGGNGAGIIFNGTLNIYGGETKNNKATGFCGGISTGNKAKDSIWQNVKICDNTAANYAGGLRWATSSANLTMSNVEISNNIVSNSTSRYEAGGVALMTGTISISGAITISGNQYNGEQNNFWNYCNTRNPSKLVIADVLDEQSVVGLTNYTVPTEDAPTPVEVATNGSNEEISDADWSRFFSDKKKYKIVRDWDTLFLSLPGTCDLSELDLTAEGAKLEPNFQADITSYEATVGNDVNTVGITATLAGSADEKTIEIKKEADTQGTTMTSGVKKDVPLTVGSNKIEITVTSGSGSDTKTKTYTLNIIRKASEVPAEYKVTLNGNDGTGTDLTSYTYGTGAKLPTDWTKTGHDFAGWYDNAGYEGTAVTEISATATGDKEYWAKWTAKTYAVTYSTNGGTIANENNFKEYTYGTGLTLPTPAKTGYTFDGWYEQSDFSGSKVTGISATDTGAKIYYAKWTLSSYTISYNLDDGTAAGNPITYTVESNPITLVNPTKEGYTFTGWSGTDLTGSNNMTVTIPKGSTGHREYTAHWTDADYTVILNGNGGKGGTSLTSYKHGTETALPTNWTRAGYTFAGWYEKADCTGTAVTKIPDTATGDKEYWAGWTPVSYSISYNLDGGTAAGNPTTYTVESSTITLKNPTKEGYTFTGWSGTGLTGEQNTTVTIPKGSTGNRTYTAHWELKGYTVTLHPNGGTGGTDLTAYTYGTVTTLPTNWTKKGYVFGGWYDKENLTGTAVTNISATDTGNKEYWAKWTDNIAPVIGTLSYDYQPKNLWQWLIGKDSLVITVPVTEEGSGADKITYTETPDGGTASTKTANITNGKAEITVSADFKGTISIACTDKANNTSASVTVGAGLGANGIIIEDNAPQIAFQAENAELLQTTGEYKTIPDIAVTIADDKDNAISAGIASVSYKIGNGSAKTVAHDYTTGMVVNDSFTIPAGEISAGETEITVTATDNAGNSNPQRYTVKVHTHSGTLVPEVKPTCTTAGNKEYYTCTCGKWFSDSGCTNEITDKSSVTESARGHDFSGEYLFDTAGHWKKCSRCAETTSKEEHHFETDGTQCTVCDYEKEGQGHTHTGELHERVEPTCTTKGNIAYYTCTCGKWFSDSSCTVEITDKSKIEIAALGHDFVMKQDQNEHWRQCTRCSLEQSRGLHEYDNDSDTDCNVCGYVRTVQHTHSGVLVPAVEATCTENGHEAYYTCTCGKWFSDSGCVNEIADHASVTVEKRGHDFSGEYLFDTAGHWKKCSRCAETTSREEHHFETDGTQCTVCDYEKEGQGHTHRGELHERVEPACTTAGNKEYYTCTCGKWFYDSSCTVEITDKSKIEIAALEHDFIMKHDQNEHWQQCSRCSLEQSRGLHEYDDDSDTDCNVCGYVRTIQHTHSGVLVLAVEPTCTEDGHEAYYTCSCGKWFSDSGCVNEIADHASVTVEKRGHDFSGGYQSDENDHWKVCSRCGETGPKEAHVYDSDTDTDCNQCGYRRNIENQGNVSKDVEKDEKAPDTILSDSAEELADIILTEEEKVQIGNGTDIKFILDVKDAGDTVSGGDKTAVQQALDGSTAVKRFSVGQYLDISLFKVIGDTRSAISQTARKLTIVINVPDSLKSKDSAKPRTYAIIRVHDGVAEVLADLDGDADTVTIATDRFSAYALVYHEAGSGADVTPSPTPGESEKPSPTPGGDKPSPTPDGSDTPSPTPGGNDKPTETPDDGSKPSPAPGGEDNVTPAPSPAEKPQKASGKEKRKAELHSGLKAVQTGKKLQISWGRVTGADGYSVYVQYCGKDFSAKSLNQVKSGKKTKITVKKVNGKKLDTTKNFKLYVVAWKWKNGKKNTLAKTLIVHIAGRDSAEYTNVRSITLGKSSYMLKKGGAVTLRPKAVLYDKHKKQLSAAHCKEFRYLSSNKKVATITAGGKVKAKGPGECTIYIFAKNGCKRKIKIKVKK